MLGKLYPCLMGEHSRGVPHGVQIIFDARFVMIGKQDGFALKEWQRVRIQVIRMAMGKANERAFLDRRLLAFWNFVAQGPAAEIRRGFDPRVGYKKRFCIVINDDRGIADRFKEMWACLIAFWPVSTVGKTLTSRISLKRIKNWTRRVLRVVMSANDQSG